jgi:prepilin-type N-terminal cleavage/methylation domain-containing protein
MKTRHSYSEGTWRNQRKTSEMGGFTLVELMISMVLLLVVSAGGFGALHQGNRLIEIARDETRAGQILQSEIEDLRTLNWSELTTLSSKAKYDPQSSFTNAYAERYDITRLITTRSATERLVTLFVTWNDNRGTPHTREYKTLISENGLYDYYYRSF